MDSEKEQQEISLIGRILSMEALLLLMGILSLAYGVVNRLEINIFWGVTIIVGVFVLHKVRKKDWKKHWEEQERMRQAYLMRKEAEKKGKEDDSEH